MNSREIKEYLKYKKYILTLSEYLKLIENDQVRIVTYHDDKFYMYTDDNHVFNFKIIND